MAANCGYKHCFYYTLDYFETASIAITVIYIFHRVQSYSRDKTNWTVQSRKLSYSGENSTESINTLKAYRLVIVSKLSFRILPPLTIFDYFRRYLYTVGISNRYFRCFLYCTIIFMIALFNQFCRDCAIGHGVFITYQNVKIEKMGIHGLTQTDLKMIVAENGKKSTFRFSISQLLLIIDHRRPVTRSLDVFFDLRLNKRLSKQWWGWWFETPSFLLWRHRNDICDGDMS